MNDDGTATQTKSISLAKPYLDRREKEAISKVIDSGWVMQGPLVEQFENRLAEYCQAKHCVVVSSGTAALHVGFMALDHSFVTTIIPSFAWPSAANLTRLMGGTPEFIDSNFDDFNIDLQEAEIKIEAEKIRNGLVVAVHQFGVPAAISELQALTDKHNLTLIEDSACALGTFVNDKHVGLFGEFGVLSFHPRKVITTGEGGAIITNDGQLADRCRAFRNHGKLKFPGYNYRMSDLQAAMGVVQMEKLPDILSLRRALIKTYQALLQPAQGYSLPTYLIHEVPESVSIQTLMITLDSDVDRDQVIATMLAEGIEVRPGSVSAHMLTAFSDCTSGDCFCPVATRLHQHGLALPLHPGLTQLDIERVVSHLKIAIASSRG